MSTLRPQLQIIADRHRSVVAAAHERLDTLSDAQLRWTPPDKRWSIVQVIDHLVRVHAATNPRFMTALLEAPFAGDESKMEVPYSAMDRLLVRILSPGTKIRLPVPKIFEPVVPKGPASAVVQKLQEQFEAFSIVLEKANEKRLKKLRVTSPANKGIRPSILAYLDATVQHNRYHWLQIETLLRDPKFPPG